MSEEKVNVTCEACAERPAVIQIVLGYYYPTATPVCKSCAQDALNKPDNWVIYVPSEEIVNA